VSFLARIAHRSVTGLVRLACRLALAGLAVITYPVFSPRALPVVLSMSVGQALGVGAFFVYLLAVVLDVARREPGLTDAVGPPSIRSPRAPEP